MPLANSGITPLERAVLDFICNADLKDGCALRTQVANARVADRENTGHGFFTRLEIDRDAPSVAERKSRDMRNGPFAKVEGAEYGMGFILWLTEGYAECLEGYCFGDEDTKKWDLERLSFDPSDFQAVPGK